MSSMLSVYIHLPASKHGWGRFSEEIFAGSTQISVEVGLRQQFFKPQTECTRLLQFCVNGLLSPEEFDERRCHRFADPRIDHVITHICQLPMLVGVDRNPPGAECGGDAVEIRDQDAAFLLHSFCPRFHIRNPLLSLCKGVFFFLRLHLEVADLCFDCVTFPGREIGCGNDFITRCLGLSNLTGKIAVQATHRAMHNICGGRSCRQTLGFLVAAFDRRTKAGQDVTGETLEIAQE